MLMSVLQQRKFDHGLSMELRQVVLDHIQKANGLEYARNEARKLQEEVARQLSLLEKKTGFKNWILNLVQHRLDME